MIVTGIDMSLTGMGVTRVDTERGEIASILIASKPHPQRARTARGKSVQLLQHRAARLHRLASAVVTIAQMSDLAVIEAPSYGSKGGMSRDRDGLWWLIVGELEANYCPVVEIAPKSRALYATGDGDADKLAIIGAVRRDYATELDDDNMADSLVLAAMGARWGGDPIERQRVTTSWQQRALRANIWPEIERGTAA